MDTQAVISNEYARQYFKTKAIQFKDIRRYDIDLLHALCCIEIDKVRRSPESIISKQLRMSRKIICNREHGVFESAFLFVNSGYFKKREAISFNSDGFIGFAGWASTTNTQPFLRAFIKWCDLLASDAE